MKKKNLILILLLNLCLHPLYAQWIQMGPIPQPLATTSITGNGSNIFLGLDLNSTDKLLMSSNSGANWVPLSYPFFTSYSQPGLIKIFGSALYVLAGSPSWSKDSLAFSTNSGSNWVNIPRPAQLVSTANFFVDGSKLYVAGVGGGSPGQGLFVTTDNGTTWNHIFNQDAVYDLYASGNNILAGGHYYGLWKSTNNGVNWTQVTATPNLKRIFHSQSGTIFWIHNGYNTIWRSTDFATSWQQINLPAEPNDFFESGSTLYCPTQNGLYKSTNDGVNWSLFSFSGVQTYFGYALGTTLLTRIPYGTYRTTNSGSNWSRLLKPSIPEVRCLSINGNNFLVATPSGVFKSSNAGTNWEEFGPHYWSPNGVAFVGPNIVVQADSIIFNTSTQPGGIYTSTNGGNTWNKSFSAYSAISMPAKIAIFGTTTFVAQGGGSVMVKSSDYGITWISTGVSARSLASNGPVLFAGDVNMGTLRSTNNGNNWVVVFSSSSTSVGANSSYVFTSLNSGGLYRSTNNGITWFPTGLYIPVAELYVDNSNVVIGSPTLGVFFSSDNGISWFERNEGFSNIPYINQFLVANNYMYAATSAGLWKRQYSEIISKVKNVSLHNPEKYQLYQNYPNPFNPKTTIKFDLVKATDVKLEVFDSKGSLIKTLVNLNLQAGSYEIDFDATSLPSGIYFYRLKTPLYEKTNKMILIK